MREYILSKISVLVARPAVAATEAMHLFDTATAFPKLSTVPLSAVKEYIYI